MKHKSLLVLLLCLLIITLSACSDDTAAQEDVVPIKNKDVEPVNYDLLPPVTFTFSQTDFKVKTGDVFDLNVIVEDNRLKKGMQVSGDLYDGIYFSLAGFSPDIIKADRGLLEIPIEVHDVSGPVNVNLATFEVVNTLGRSNSMFPLYILAFYNVIKTDVGYVCIKNDMNVDVGGDCSLNSIGRVENNAESDLVKLNSIKQTMYGDEETLMFEMSFSSSGDYYRYDESCVRMNECPLNRHESWVKVRIEHLGQGPLSCTNLVVDKNSGWKEDNSRIEGYLKVPLYRDSIMIECTQKVGTGNLEGEEPVKVTLSYMMYEEHTGSLHLES